MVVIYFFTTVFCDCLRVLHVLLSIPYSAKGTWTLEFHDCMKH